MNDSVRQGFARRLGLSCSGAVAGALAAALGLAAFESAALQVSVWDAWGLHAPVALVAAGLVALWVPLVHRSRTLPRLSHLLAKPEHRFRLLLAAPAVVLAWWGAGHLALRLIVAFEDKPQRGGLLLAVTALGCLVMGGQLVYSGAQQLSARKTPPGRLLSIAVAVLLLLVLLVLSIAVGNTSGSGAPWALFGVLRRDELNLEPPLFFSLMVVTSYLGAYASLVRPLAKAWVPLAAVALLGGGLAVSRAAHLSWTDALRFERSRSLSALSMNALARLSDADGDGYGKAFGGGDCNDRAWHIAPGRPEIPGNGIDEDCSGADRELPLPNAPSEQAAAPTKEAFELPPSPNFLLLTIDTLRWDVGYTGKATRNRLTPELDALAQRSVVFERAYSLASYTSKSLGPLLIGRYPSETARTFEHFDRFSKDVPFVQERLQDAGIATVSVQGYWYFFFKSYGFERGFDILDSSAAPRVIAIEGDRTKNGDKVATAAIERLQGLATQGKQFFAWVHWVDPHTEYVPHPEFDYGSEPRERYDGEVSFVDAQVGRVLRALEEFGLARNTVILVTSDHGEAFGEHGMIRHGFEVWEELVRVPLVLHVPGASARRIEARRSGIDVAPTILQTFGIEPPSGEDFVRGESLLEDALAPLGAEPEERPILVDMPKGPHNQQRRAFYTGDKKLITSDGRVIGLYDLSRDPAEKHDLSEDADLVNQVRAEMEKTLASLHEVAPR